PSAYLFVNTEPIASITASDTKFSDAINSIFSCWRFFSACIASYISGSACLTCSICETSYVFLRIIFKILHTEDRSLSFVIAVKASAQEKHPSRNEVYYAVTHFRFFITCTCPAYQLWPCSRTGYSGITNISLFKTQWYCNMP